MLKPLNVLIVSASSMGNIGDNIVGLVNEGLIKETHDNVNVRHAVLNQNPYDDVGWADIVVIGGGGILYDWSKDNVDNYIHYIDLAKYSGKKVIVSGVGVQGIHTKYGKRRYRETLNIADCLIVRDEKDAEQLSGIGVTIPIQTITDLAMLFPDMLPSLQESYGYTTPDKFTRLQVLKESSKKPLLGVSLSSEDADLNETFSESEKARKKSLENIKIDTLKRLEDTYKIILMAHSRDDVALYEEANQLLKDAEYIAPLSQLEALGALDIYRCFDSVFTSRYHGFLLGALTRKPMVIVTGANSAKIEKTINSQLTAYKENIIEINNLAHVNSDVFQVKNYFSDIHDTQVNNLIQSASMYHSYIGAVLSGGYSE